MNLIYLDESGTNSQIKDGLYVDGPFLIMGAMFISEDVYWSMERLFTEIIDKYFGIDDWLNNEVHATDIWFGNVLSSRSNIDKRREFFDEFLQLCGKFGLPYVFSFNLKHLDQEIEKRNLDMMKAAYCLLVGIEHRLANIHQTGVLVCDSSSNAKNLKIKDIINLDIKKHHFTPAQALLRQFHEMTSWRSTKSKPSFTIPPKYQMESMSAYLIDRVHFLRSDDSLFLQVCDIMTFIIQRTLVHDYLLTVAHERIEPEKLPITRDGWAMMRNQIYPNFYGEKSCDVTFCDVAIGYAALLLDFTQIFDLSMIKDHYKQMQPTS